MSDETTPAPPAPQAVGAVGAIPTAAVEHAEANQGAELKDKAGTPLPAGTDHGEAANDPVTGEGLGVAAPPPVDPSRPLAPGEVPPGQEPIEGGGHAVDAREGPDTAGAVPTEADVKAEQEAEHPADYQSPDAPGTGAPAGWADPSATAAWADRFPGGMEPPPSGEIDTAGQSAPEGTIGAPLPVLPGAVAGPGPEALGDDVIEMNLPPLGDAHDRTSAGGERNPQPCPLCGRVDCAPPGTLDIVAATHTPPYDPADPRVQILEPCWVEVLPHGATTPTRKLVFSRGMLTNRSIAERHGAAYAIVGDGGPPIEVIG